MSGSRYDVLGLGNAIVDVLARADDALLERYRLAKGSMSLVDAERADQVYGAMHNRVERSGGSAANTMVGLASLGGASAYVGKVRDDTLGQVFAEDLRKEGVAYATRPARGGPGTGRCLILVTPDAQRTMQTFLGASATLGPEDLSTEMIEAAGVLYLEGYLWDAPAAKAAMRAAAGTARRAGRKVALTLSDAFCVERHREEFVELLDREVDYLFANEAEILALFRAKALGDALEAVRGRCEVAAVTLGERGSVLLTSDGSLPIAPEPPSQLIDTTGAGDLYAAGFLYGITHGHDLAGAGRLGSRAASRILTHFGSRPEIPLRNLVGPER